MPKCSCQRPLCLVSSRTQSLRLNTDTILYVVTSLEHIATPTSFSLDLRNAAFCA